MPNVLLALSVSDHHGLSRRRANAPCVSNCGAGVCISCEMQATGICRLRDGARSLCAPSERAGLDARFYRPPPCALRVTPRVWVGGSSPPGRASAPSRQAAAAPSNPPPDRCALSRSGAAPPAPMDAARNVGAVRSKRLAGQQRARDRAVPDVGRRPGNRRRPSALGTIAPAPTVRQRWASLFGDRGSRGLAGA